MIRRPTVACLAVLALAGCGGSDENQGELRVERATTPEGTPELLISVTGRVSRDPAVASSGETVGVVCRDEAGRTTVSGRHRWPFEVEAGFDLPHVHQVASASQVARTVSCRLTGTRIPVEGSVG